MDYLSGSNVIKKVLKTEEKGRIKKSKWYVLRRTQLDIASFAYGRREPQAKEGGQPLEAGKAREQILPQSLQKGTKPHQHHDLSLMKLLSYFCLPEL